MSFSPELLIVDYHSKDAGKLFTQSLKDTGFAVIKNHPISAQLIDDVYNEWKAFFAQPLEKKMQYLYKANEGYFPLKSESAKYTDIHDLKEFYHLYPTWGRIPENIADHTLALFQQMNSLANTAMSWIEDNLPQAIQDHLKEPLRDALKNSERTVLRILNYPPLTGEEEEGAVRAAPHEDIGALTFLPAATAKGLQVQDSKGVWHEVPCDYGTIVVNTGDSLTALTEGYLPSTTHQVTNPTGALAKEPRLSMPLFMHPRDDVRLPDGRTAHDFLMERLRELGQEK